MRWLYGIAAFLIFADANPCAHAADKVPLANYGGGAIPIKSSDTADLPGLKILNITGSTQCVQAAPTGLASGVGAPCGTVTSVALSLPGIFTVSGSPVTSSGTLTGALASQNQNLVFASPNGSSGAPSFRALIGADLPNPSASTLGGIESLTCAAHNWLNTISTLGVPGCSQPAAADVSGLGTFATQNYATPPAIGGTTPNAGAFSTLDATTLGSITPPNATVSQLHLDTGTKTATATAGAATLNKMAGVITSESLTTAAAATYTLTLTNSDIAATDQVFASVQNGSSTTGMPVVTTVTPGANQVVVVVQNVAAAAAFNGTIKISFAVLKN